MLSQEKPGTLDFDGHIHTQELSSMKALGKPLQQRFSSSLMLQPFSTVVLTPTTEAFCYYFITNFAAVVKSAIDI